MTPQLKTISPTRFGCQMFRWNRKPRWTLAVAILNLLLPTTAYGQVADKDPAVRLRTDLVLLDVQVLNKKTGRMVGKLRKEDFLLQEDGVRQEITHFSQDKLPLSVVLLVDVSGSVQRGMSQIRDGALYALQRLKPDDEIALVAFATSVRMIQEFTKDKRLVAEKIAEINNTAQVGKMTFLNEGIYQAVRYWKDSPNPNCRRVLITITDNVSSQPLLWGHSENAVLRELLELDTMVCGLLVNAKSAPKLFRFAARGDVKTYAEKTGGVVFAVKKETVERAWLELIEHIRTRYAIGYTSTNTKNDGKLRKIKLLTLPEIEVREGKLQVLCRQGYYAR